MDVLTFFKTKKRITKDCTVSCSECMLHLTCKGYIGITDPENAVKIVEKWLEENPEPTYRSVLLEKFPHAFEYSTPCVAAIFGDKHTNEDCNSCHACWNRTYKED